MSGNLRSRLFNMDTRVGRLTEAASGITVILALATLVLHTVVTEGSTADVWLDRAEITFWVLFTVEYAMRIFASAHPFRYLRSFYGIVDLLAVVAGLSSIEMLGAAKPLRLLRALRVLKLARYSSAVDRFSEAFDDIKRRTGPLLRSDGGDDLHCCVRDLGV